jgi:putative membrane protein
MDKVIICIDRDNDIGIKAGVKSPVIGKENNLAAAAKLGIVDPEDSDINTIYAGVKLYDILIEDGCDVEIISIAGDSDVGLISDQKISDQLDDIIKKYGVKNAILVSDGAEDESVLPIIESRVKVDSVHRVIVKQSQNLESTYYLLKTAFNDPKISHTFFVPIGLAALIYSVFLFAGDPKYAWAAILGAIGIYMLYRGFGLDDVIGDVSSRMKQSLISGRISFVTYSLAFILILIGTILGIIRFWEYYTRIDVFVGVIILVMLFVNLSIWWYVAAGWVAIIGRMIDLYMEGLNYKQHWSYLFFLMSSGLLLWGASTFILSVSDSVNVYLFSSDTGRNLLVLSIVGAVIVWLIGIWISARTSNAKRNPETT